MELPCAYFFHIWVTSVTAEANRAASRGFTKKIHHRTGAERVKNRSIHIRTCTFLESKGPAAGTCSRAVLLQGNAAGISNEHVRVAVLLSVPDCRAHHLHTSQICQDPLGSGLAVATKEGQTRWTREEWKGGEQMTGENDRSERERK